MNGEDADRGERGIGSRRHFLALCSSSSIARAQIIAWFNVRQMLTAEERDVVARAKLGGGRADNLRKHSSKRLDRDLPSVPQYSYPANASPKTLGLLGKLDALLKAEPRPPNWALMRVLSLLEENEQR